MIDVEKICKKIATVHNFPYEIILISFLAKLSSVFSYHRLKFQLPNEEPTIANIYTLAFAPSGFGKNKSLKKLDQHLFKKCNEYIKKDLLNKEQFRSSEIEIEANKYAGYKDPKDGTSKINFNKKKEYLEKNGARTLTHIISDATVEGLQADLWELSQYETAGSLLFKNTEFLDYVTVQTKDNSYLLSYIADAFDHGDGEAKSTKGEKQSKKTFAGIPLTLAAYASADVMHEDKSYKLIMNKIGSAFARRSFIFFKKDFTQEVKTVEDRISNLKNNSNIKIDYTDDFLAILKKLSFTKGTGFKTFKLDIDSNVASIFYGYEQGCETKAITEKNIYIRNDLNGRPWRAIKLATILQALYNAKSEVIEDRAINDAIKFCEFFAEGFSELSNDSPKNHFQKLYEYFLENISKPIGMTELAHLSFVGNKNYFSSMFKEFKEYAEDRAQSEGLVFEKIKGMGNHKLHVLKTITKKLEGK